MASTDSSSLFVAAWRWLRDSLRERGVLGSAKYFGPELMEFMRDSMPERRRSRFGDIDYDIENSVDTTWARLPIKVRLRELFSERLYQPTMPEEFNEIMQQFATVDFSTYTFIDLGSGKGRALLMAALYPFREVIGVEVQPELNTIAERNIANFHDTRVQCRSVRSLCMDARQFEFPQTDILLYLFNPFPDYVLRQVLQNLVISVRKNPRSVIVVYNAPFERQEFDRIPELVPTYGTHQYQLYTVTV